MPAPPSPSSSTTWRSTQTTIGILLRQAGQPAAALAPLQEALAIARKLADASPSSTDSQLELANAELEIGDALRLTGNAPRPGHATNVGCRSSTKLVDAQPALTDQLQIFLLFGWKGLGATQQAASEPAGAVASWRRGVATDEHVRTSLGETLYYLAGCHARLGGIAGAAGSGLPATEGPAELDRAMALFRRAVNAGYRDVSWMNRDPDLDPLRARPDFQAMLADLAFPDYPFSRDAEAEP